MKSYQWERKGKKIKEDNRGGVEKFLIKSIVESVLLNAVAACFSLVFLAHCALL